MIASEITKQGRFNALLRRRAGLTGFSSNLHYSYLISPERPFCSDKAMMA
ncbi:hypothetical protein KCP71_25795 [Salmonella enterica subsp. enterica]|nr:hypothetical protein KCP71_25795 [Salmonella enterica subsp. enterica]